MKLLGRNGKICTFSSINNQIEIIVDEIPIISWSNEIAVDASKVIDINISIRGGPEPRSGFKFFGPPGRNRDWGC